jgi:hypothetical protein
MQGSNEFNRLQRDMMPRDAVISFRCSAPDFVQVSETIDGECLHHPEVQRHAEVVAEIEEIYIFFAKQADAARSQVMRGHSCLFNVYFREP